MRDRLLCAGLLVLSLVLPLVGCSNPSGLDAIQISPTSPSLAVGHTTQFTVMGTYGNSKHPTNKPVTDGVTWTSSNTAVVTIDSTGLAKAISAGSATVTASAQGYNGTVTSTADVTVTGSGGSTGGVVTTVTITPATQTIAGAGTTVQFTAIGTTSSGATLNLTNQVVWISSATSVATIGASTGLAQSVAAGTTSISALYSDSSSGSTVLGTASLTVTAASSGAYTNLTLIPSSQNLSASGQTGNFIALATTGSGTVVDVDPTKITWASSIDSIATVNNGVATGVSAGTSTITALLKNPDNSVVSGTATVTVSLTTPAEPILSLEVIPDTITVNDFNLSGQFIAIGTYSTAPYVRDVTNDAATTWLSSEPNFFPVNTNSGGGVGASAGIVTAEGSGTATIIAESKSTDGTIQSATATFNCPFVLAVADSQTPPSCPNTAATGSPLLSTLTVYNRGLNTTTWQVTASSATGTPNVLHCGPGWAAGGGSGGSVCTATYPVGTTVTLTSPAGAGAFGGWSYNCRATGTITAAGPNSCTITLSSDGTATGHGIDDVVGIIVN